MDIREQVNKLWVPLGAAAISGIIAVVISNYQLTNFQIRQEKIKTLSEIYANRYVLLDPVLCHGETAERLFFNGLNKASIIFSKSEDVIDAIVGFNDAITDKGDSNRELNRLYRAMMDDIGLPYGEYIYSDSPFRRKCKSKNQKALNQDE
ncbi:hypothetical protein [Pseudoalteromonas denitrificans]|uniref:Uncharacterized protein n=1 Tax=Pseudoalteromonas denitrificans DSM 6059 TaxID=1123010 RepID=A0A1I1UNZ5_9GAMM|nr:hypothetical protein [Pseudoalteromonas denitrificans]SFD72424.1 hypothetical protein SAMN02745724_05292 [Pseudoalteromonas denitrificans DSM 6059]